MARKSKRAAELLENGDPARALELGRELADAGVTDGFELEALALLELGRLDAASARLAFAVERAPLAWRLWKLLGDVETGRERYDAAEAAYARGVLCPDADVPGLRLSAALALQRSKRFDEALAMVAEIVAPSEALQRLRVSVLCDLRRFGEAVSLAERVVASAEAPDEIAQMRGELARLRLAQGDRAGALRLAREISATHFVPTAAAVIRELEGKRTPGAKSWRLEVAGTWSEPLTGEQQMAFIRVFKVVADSVEEAIEATRGFAPDDVGPTMRVLTVEAHVPAADALHGVTWASGYVFHPVET